MSHISRHSLPNERIFAIGHPHWIIFAAGGLLTLLGLGLMMAMGLFWGAPSFALGVGWLAKAWVHRATTELAITSRRVIAKYGFVRARTIEFDHKNVESFLVEQSLLGRILNFGTVVVNGVGGGQTPMATIARPLDLRRTALAAAETPSYDVETAVIASSDVLYPIGQDEQLTLHITVSQPRDGERRLLVRDRAGRNDQRVIECQPEPPKLEHSARAAVDRRGTDKTSTHH